MNLSNFGNLYTQTKAHNEAEDARNKVKAAKEAEAKAAADFQARKHRIEIVAPPPPLTEEEAIILIQVSNGDSLHMSIT